MHATLFDHAELNSGPGGRAPSPQVLANTVQLTSSDAARWKEMRRAGATLPDLYGECEERTNEAEVIWQSQRGWMARRRSRPLELVHARSAQLLSEVVPGLAG